jgi:hypothetical protein
MRMKAACGKLLVLQDGCDGFCRAEFDAYVGKDGRTSRTSGMGWPPANPQYFPIRIHTSLLALVAITASLNGLTMPRSRSRKSCASGLIVLPFNVMIPIGRRVPGNSTGNALMDAGRLGEVNESAGVTTGNGRSRATCCAG